MNRPTHDVVDSVGIGSQLLLLLLLLLALNFGPAHLLTKRVPGTYDVSVTSETSLVTESKSYEFRLFMSSFDVIFLLPFI